MQPTSKYPGIANPNHASRQARQASATKNNRSNNIGYSGLLTRASDEPPAKRLKTSDMRDHRPINLRELLKLNEVSPNSPQGLTLLAQESIFDEALSAITINLIAVFTNTLIELANPNSGKDNCTLNLQTIMLKKKLLSAMKGDPQSRNLNLFKLVSLRVNEQFFQIYSQIIHTIGFTTSEAHRLREKIHTSIQDLKLPNAFIQAFTSETELTYATNLDQKPPAKQTESES